MRKYLILIVIGIFLSLQSFALTPFSLTKATVWNNGTPFDATIDENIITMKGTAGRQCAGIVLEDRINIGKAAKIIIEVRGASNPDNTFSDGRLFKLEIDRKALKTKNISDRNSKDTEYINATNGIFVFPLTDTIVQKGYISKFQIVLYDCKISNIKLTVSLE